MTRRRAGAAGSGAAERIRRRHPRGPRGGPPPAAGAGPGHDLHQRRRPPGADGVADPVELPGLRFGGGGARHRHQPAQPGAAASASIRVHPTASAGGARPCHTHHARLRHPGRGAADELRRDGRAHAAPGARAADAAHRACTARTRRRPATARAGTWASRAKWRWSRGFRRSSANCSAARPPAEREAPTLLFGGAQVVSRLPGGYCAASDPRKDGQAVAS